jgi:glycosidase
MAWKKYIWILLGLAAVVLAGALALVWVRQTASPGPGPSSVAPTPTPGSTSSSLPANHPKDWPKHAIWYQIFPERFRNGDPKNDPTAEYSRVPDQVRAKWRITPWTKEWYGMDEWEKELAPDAYGTMHHRRYGGDFQGIMDKLDYLKELGVTAIYFNPIFESTSLHKYDARSYHHADPHFGPDPEGDKALILSETADPTTWKWTAADKMFLELVRQAHARGIRVILDGVFNHCATDFFAFADLKKNQEKSPYTHWFHVNHFDDPKTTDRNEFDYAGWWGVKAMPEFSEVTDEKGRKNLDPEVKAYLFAITKRWMDPNGDGDPSDGVDGWRLDVANEVGTGFWVEWNDYVKSINPLAYTVPEIWVEAQDFMREAKFDGVMNYYAFAMPIKGGMIHATLSTREFLRLIEDRRKKFTWEEALRHQNLFDSHDTDRFPSMIVNRNRPYFAKEDAFGYDGDLWAGSTEKPYLIRKPTPEERKLQRMLTLFQVAYPGAPYLYYGTEVGMWSADDPDDRMPMVWPDLTFEPQKISPAGQPMRNDDLNFDASLHSFYKEALALRRKHPELVDGPMRVLGGFDRSQTFAWVRDGARPQLAVFNRNPDQQTHVIALKDLPPGKFFSPNFVSSGSLDDIQVTPEGETLRITLPGWTGGLLSAD